MKIDKLKNLSEVSISSLRVDNSIFLFDVIRPLTGFCAPVLQCNSGGTRLNFDIGIVAFSSDDLSHEHFVSKISRLEYLALPKTIPVAHSEDMLVTGNELSDWAKAQMRKHIADFTLDRREAQLLLAAGLSDVIAKFRRVYGERFGLIVEKELY